MAQFADNLNEMLDSQPIAEADAASAAEATPGPNGDETSGGTGSAGSAEAAGGGEASGGAATAPRVRKIEGPATEPVDLAGVAGPAVLKRLLPIVAGLVLLLLVLRRRR
jgi:hypothetical protein